MLTEFFAHVKEKKQSYAWFQQLSSLQVTSLQAKALKDVC
jgi:hypothetical protein